jgi:hypothetical protein
VRWLKTVVKLAAHTSYPKLIPGAVLELPELNAADNPWWPFDPNKPSNANSENLGKMKLGESFHDQATDSSTKQLQAFVINKLQAGIQADIEHVLLKGHSAEKKPFYLEDYLLPKDEPHITPMSEYDKPVSIDMEKLKEKMSGVYSKPAYEKPFTFFPKEPEMLNYAPFPAHKDKVWKPFVPAVSGVNPGMINQAADNGMMLWNVAMSLNDLVGKVTDLPMEFVPAHVFGELTNMIDGMAKDIYTLQTQMQSLHTQLIGTQSTLLALSKKSGA